MQIIDLEASGLHPDSYPIEVGVYDIEDPDNSFGFLIKPDQTWTHWDYNAQDIHGLSRDYIEQDGITIQEACRVLNERLGDVVLSDAVAFENMWLATLFETANQTPTFIVGSVYDHINLMDLGDFEAELFSGNTPHRALEDARIIGEVVKKYRR